MSVTFEEIKTEWMKRVNDDKTVQKYLHQIKEGRGNYVTANKVSKRVGEQLAKTLKSFSAEGNISEWDFVNLIPECMGLDHAMIVDVCRDVQNTMNKEAGLGIKYQEPKFNWDRVNGLIDEIQTHENFSDIEKSFYNQLVNFSENIVDDSIRDNAGKLFRSGIRTLIIRQAEFGACPWCKEVAGSYDFNEVRGTGDDVWRRHEKCHCTIDYITERQTGFYTERVNNYKKKKDKEEL